MMINNLLILEEVLGSVKVVMLQLLVGLAGPRPRHGTLLLLLGVLRHGIQQLIKQTRKHSSWPCPDWGRDPEEVLTYFIQVLKILRISVNELFVFLTENGVSRHALRRLDTDDQ